MRKASVRYKFLVQGPFNDVSDNSMVSKPLLVIPMGTNTLESAYTAIPTETLRVMPW